VISSKGTYLVIDLWCYLLEMLQGSGGNRLGRGGINPDKPDEFGAHHSVVSACNGYNPVVKK